MNSFRSVSRALDHELGRQAEILEQGGLITQETRGWSELEQQTVSQRTKEAAQEYRYFPEPDLPPLTVSREQVESVRAGLPELPTARRERFVAQFGLALDQARLLTARPRDSEYFEAVVAAGITPQLAANWQLGDLQGLCNAANITVDECRVGPLNLARLLEMVEGHQVTAKVAKEVLGQAFETGASPAELVRSQGLGQLSDVGDISVLVDQVLERNGKAAQDYQGGNDRALGALVGAVMGLSQGRANPEIVNQLLRARLPRPGG